VSGSFSAAMADYEAAAAAWDDARRALAAREAAGFVLGLHEIDPACDLAMQAIQRTSAACDRARARNARRRAARLVKSGAL